MALYAGYPLLNLAKNRYPFQNRIMLRVCPRALRCHIIIVTSMQSPPWPHFNETLLSAALRSRQRAGDGRVRWGDRYLDAMQRK